MDAHPTEVPHPAVTVMVYFPDESTLVRRANVFLQEPQLYGLFYNMNIVPEITLYSGPLQISLIMNTFISCMIKACVYMDHKSIKIVFPHISVTGYFPGMNKHMTLEITGRPKGFPTCHTAMSFLTSMS